MIDKMLEESPENRIYEDDIREIAEYCAKNGIELLDVTSNSNHYFHVDSDTPAVAFIDPESGKEIWIHPNYLAQQSKNILSTNGTDLIESISEIQKNLSDMPVGYIDKLNVVSLCHEDDNCLGYFWAMYPNNIHINPNVFGSSTGLKGTMVHELTHLNEYNNYGYTGANKTFVDNKKLFPNHKPTLYGEFDGSENITTMVEQVYTHRLRDDAIMQNGRYVNLVFADKHNGRLPRTDAEKEDAYNIWANEWHDAVVETEKWIDGGFMGPDY